MLLKEDCLMKSKGRVSLMESSNEHYRGPINVLRRASRQLMELLVLGSLLYIT